MSKPAPVDAPETAPRGDGADRRVRRPAQRAEATPRQDLGRRFWREALRRRMLAGAELVGGALVTALAAATTAEVVWSRAILPVWVVLSKLFGLYGRDQ